MSDFWYDPLELGAGDLLSDTLGQMPLSTAWPGGTTLGDTSLATIYRPGQTLGDTPLSERWLPDPPGPSKPTMIFSDGFENQNHTSWAGGSGGRAQDCDCATTCPGGPRDTNDPLDTFTPSGSGYSRRVKLRFACKALNASCLNACEAAKERSSYILGSTEYHAHRVRIWEPYTGQVGFCLISQIGYCLLKYNAFGLNLLGTNLQLYCNLGESKASPTHYTHAGGWELRDGDHTLVTNAWRDYIWTITYSTIFGTDGTHTVPGYLKVESRLPQSTSTWSTLYDSIDDFPAGVPTRQWGYNLSDVNEVNNLGKKVSDGTTNQKVYEKVGAYRNYGSGSENNNDFTTDHRYGIAADFATAEAYLDWCGT